MVTMSTIRRRVNRGVAKLNELSPGWLSKVNPDKLVLNSYSGCVLAQIYGDYGAGLNAIGISFYDMTNMRERVNLGFSVNGEPYDVHKKTEEFWKRKLRKLQSA